MRLSLSPPPPPPSPLLLSPLASLPPFPPPPSPLLPLLSLAPSSPAPLSLASLLPAQPLPLTAPVCADLVCTTLTCIALACAALACIGLALHRPRLHPARLYRSRLHRASLYHTRLQCSVVRPASPALAVRYLSMTSLCLGRRGRSLSKRFSLQIKMVTRRVQVLRSSTRVMPARRIAARRIAARRKGRSVCTVVTSCRPTTKPKKKTRTMKKQAGPKKNASDASRCTAACSQAISHRRVRRCSRRCAAGRFRPTPALLNKIKQVCRRCGNHCHCFYRQCPTPRSPPLPAYRQLPASLPLVALAITDIFSLPGLFPCRSVLELCCLGSGGKQTSAGRHP